MHGQKVGDSEGWEKSEQEKVKEENEEGLLERKKNREKRDYEGRLGWSPKAR